MPKITPLRDRLTDLIKFAPGYGDSKFYVLKNLNEGGWHDITDYAIGLLSANNSDDALNLLNLTTTLNDYIAGLFNAFFPDKGRVEGDYTKITLDSFGRV